MSKVLLIDNYDSFTYNLVQLIEQITGLRPRVARNDEIELSQVGEYEQIVLSPGPGIPAENGLLLDVIRNFAPLKPMLGVCLGHQAIAEAMGGALINLPNVLHGISSKISIIAPENPLLSGLETNPEVGHYHSWVVDEEALPDTLQILAKDQEDNIMAIAHRELPVWGVQFHPESVLTPQGHIIMRNFLNTK